MYSEESRLTLAGMSPAKVGHGNSLKDIKKKIPDFSGKIVIVTGGDQGIGFAITKVFPPLGQSWLSPTESL